MLAPSGDPDPPPVADPSASYLTSREPISSNLTSRTTADEAASKNPPLDISTDRPTVDHLAAPHSLDDDLLGRLDSVDVAFDDVLTGLARCDAAATLTLAARLARLTARLQGLTINAHVHLARRYPADPRDGDGAEPYPAGAADELAAVLEQSPRTMSGRLAQAWEIAHQLPAALADLTAGMLDHTRLAALHQLTLCLTPEQRAIVEATMLDGSRLASPPCWRRKINRLVNRLDAHAAAKRRKKAHTERRIGIDPLSDGMAQLTMIIAAEDAQAIYDRVNQITRAAHDPTDTRAIDARRADVLTALLLGNRREHVQVEIQVIAPVGTLAGLDDNPAELVGFGPIPADVGRALAADAHWRRVLTDPVNGTVLDLGHRRVPTPALARLVRHQQGRCLFPGCGMPANRTDIDHTVAHEAGGRTALDNLGLLCRRHHGAKHSGWTLGQPQPGVFHWTSPTRRTYLTDTTHNEEEGHRLDDPSTGLAFGPTNRQGSLAAAPSGESRPDTTRRHVPSINTPSDRRDSVSQAKPERLTSDRRDTAPCPF
jgi:hypothetical protein